MKIRKPEHLDWMLIFGAGLLLEWLAIKRKKGTLSEATRKTLRTHTTLGRIFFIWGWVTFAVWFLLHIIATPKKK